MRKIIHIDEEKCDGCGLCVPACHEGAIRIMDGKARLVAEKYCDGLGDCLGQCPRGAITIVDREAEPFDGEAVKSRLASEKEGRRPSAPAAGGCPGGSTRLFAGSRAGDPSGNGAGQGGACPGSRMRIMSGKRGGNGASGSAPTGTVSALGHWPIKLELIHPEAPFLEGADLLLTADCAPPSIPSFNERFLAGRAVAVACPKFGDRRLFLERLKEIAARSKPRKITVLHMEVPCCSGLIQIAREALDSAGSPCPLETIRIGLDGRVEDPIPLPGAR